MDSPLSFLGRLHEATDQQSIGMNRHCSGVPRQTQPEGGTVGRNGDDSSDYARIPSFTPQGHAPDRVAPRHERRSP